MKLNTVCEFKRSSYELKPRGWKVNHWECCRGAVVRTRVWDNVLNKAVTVCLCRQHANVVARIQDKRFLGATVYYNNQKGGYPYYEGIVTSIERVGHTGPWAHIKWKCPVHPCTTPMELEHLRLEREKQ